jgi:hypothetical protein
MKKRNKCSLAVLIMMVLLLAGCTEKGQDGNCDDTPMVFHEMILNGQEADLFGDWRYDTLYDFWIGIENEREYLFISNDTDFVLLRIDENDYGFLYGGEYTCNEKIIKFAVYANNEVIKEYEFEYEIDKQILTLKDKDGTEIQYRRALEEDPEIEGY